MSSQINTDAPGNEEKQLLRTRLSEVLASYVEGSLPSGLWLPAERLCDRLEAELPELDVPTRLSAPVRAALSALRGDDRSRLPMAASSAPAPEMLLQGELVGVVYGLAVDVDGEGELVQVEVRGIEIRPAERSRATINTYGPLARVVAIDGGIVANSQFTDSVRRLERLLERHLPGREVIVECEVSYCRGAEPSRRRPIEGSSLSGAVALAIISKLYERPVSRRLAVSFSVASDGMVAPVDQAADKAKVAARHGIEQLIVPASNQADLAAAPARLRPQEVLFIRHVDELWVPALASGSMPAAAPVLRGFWNNLRHRALLRDLLGPQGRPRGIVIDSGPDGGDTTLLS
jgi:hypothetical protein